MEAQDRTRLPSVRCRKSFRHKAYKLAQQKDMSYAELVRFLIRKEIDTNG